MDVERKEQRSWQDRDCARSEVMAHSVAVEPAGGKKLGQEISSEQGSHASSAAVISPSYVTGQRFHWEPQRSADTELGSWCLVR